MGEKSYEKNIENSKAILEKLMQPDITLSESMQLYKEGLGELEAASKLLEDAKQEFEVLTNKESDNELLS